MTKKIGTIIILIAILGVIAWGIRELVSPKAAATDGNVSIIR